MDDFHVSTGTDSFEADVWSDERPGTSKRPVRTSASSGGMSTFDDVLGLALGVTYSPAMSEQPEAAGVDEAAEVAAIVTAFWPTARAASLVKHHDEEHWDLYLAIEDFTDEIYDRIYDAEVAFSRAVPRRVLIVHGRATQGRPVEDVLPRAGRRLF